MAVAAGRDHTQKRVRVKDERCGTVLARDSRGVVQVFDDGLDEVLSTPQVAQVVEASEELESRE